MKCNVEDDTNPEPKTQPGIHTMDAAGVAFFLLALAWCSAAPLLEDQVINNVDKRTLGDPPALASLGPYGFYPGLSGTGIKPLRPIILPPGFFLDRLATTPPPVDPMAAFFKARKDAFLNKLFEDLTTVTDAPGIQVRSVVDPADATPTDAVTSTTVKPKIDPSIFITKKFDFLATLFKTLNTTTPAPTVDPADPTGTTVKPTIVPAGFWVPAGLPTKPPKATKAPKPEKTKGLLLNAIDEALLKNVLAQVDPTNAALSVRQAALQPPTQVSFLDKLLHRLTEAPPITASTESPLEGRSAMFPPGYWVPPYIYAAKMGIYLDKLFDTIDDAATDNGSEDDVLDEGKRSVATDGGDPSSMLLAELTALKNDMLAAYLDGLKAAKEAPPSTKPTPKTFKKPMWGPKTTPTPDPTQQKLTLLSDVYDKLAAVQQQLLSGPPKLNLTSTSGTAATSTPTPTPDFWAPDPAAVDIGEFYKSKTQEFLSDLFASKFSTTPANEV